MRSSWRLFLGFALIALNSSAAVASERGAGKPISVANAPLPGPHEPILNGRSSGARGTTRAIERTSDSGVMTIVLGGDLGLGGSNQPVDATGAFRHGQKHDWHELTSGIAPLFDGDINFANLETVVTDRNDLRANPKSFNFKSHPEGVHHLARLGLNVFSTANNHAIDYGQTGIRESLRHLEGAKVHGLLAWPGLGLGRDEALRPADITVNGARVRISAIGIGGGGMPSGETSGNRPKAGMLNYNSTEDFKDAVAHLTDAAGDLRILSVHYGAELQVRASPGDVFKLRDQAAKEGGIDIVVGHHAHVAAGVQLVNGNVVLYGLGNLLHPGMQNMGRFGVCRDYGLVVRVLFSSNAIGKLIPRAIEAVPITDMHARAKPLNGDAGRLRVEVLNYLAAELDDEKAGASGVRFAPRADGSGLYCLPGAAQERGTIGAKCEGWEPPPPASTDIERRIAASCSNGLIARRKSGPDSAAISETPRTRVTRQKPKNSSDSTLLTSIFGW